MNEKSKATMLRKLLDLLIANPGLDAAGLWSHGWRPLTHGNLRKAEIDGLIEYRNGWHVTEKTSA